MLSATEPSLLQFFFIHLSFWSMSVFNPLPRTHTHTYSLVVRPFPVLTGFPLKQWSSVLSPLWGRGGGHLPSHHPTSSPLSAQPLRTHCSLFSSPMQLLGWLWIFQQSNSHSSKLDVFNLSLCRFIIFLMSWDEILQGFFRTWRAVKWRLNLSES